MGLIGFLMAFVVPISADARTRGTWDRLRLLLLPRREGVGFACLFVRGIRTERAFYECN